MLTNRGFSLYEFSTERAFLAVFGLPGLFGIGTKTNEEPSNRPKQQAKNNTFARASLSFSDNCPDKTADNRPKQKKLHINVYTRKLAESKVKMANVSKNAVGIGLTR